MTEDFIHLSIFMIIGKLDKSHSQTVSWNTVTDLKIPDSFIAYRSEYKIRSIHSMLSTEWRKVKNILYKMKTTIELGVLKI